MRLKSPAEIEIAYTRRERRLYRRLAENSNIMTLLLGTILLAGFVQYSSYYFIDQEFEFSIYGGLITMRMIRYGILAAIPLSLISLVLPAHLQLGFQFISIVLIWFGSAQYFFSSVGTAAFALCLLSVPLICGAGYLAMRHCAKSVKRWPAAALFSALYIAVVSVTSYQLWDHTYELRMFWRFKTTVLFIMFLVNIFKPRITNRDLHFASNPFHALRGEYWPTNMRWSHGAGRTILWWQGMCNLTLGYGLVMARLLVEENFGPPYVSLFHKVFTKYLLIVAVQVGVYNVVAGVVRLFGYRVADATFFVIFARTPAELWRRGSVYTYQFILRYVYLPLFRGVSRNLFFVTAVSFAVFFLNHLGVLHLAKFAGSSFGWVEELSHTEMFQLRFHLLLYFQFFLTIYISNRFWFFSRVPRNNAYLVWASILLTHFVMILVRFSAELIALSLSGGRAIE
ncbi:MAG: hypothetical protein HC883_03295 [Bdellovibrionaceae bacterium]|nr:hypothetical protein [Pseudobdellovibrionaceae bacterium]